MARSALKGAFLNFITFASSGGAAVRHNLLKNDSLPHTDGSVLTVLSLIPPT